MPSIPMMSNDDISPASDSVDDASGTLSSSSTVGVNSLSPYIKGSGNLIGAAGGLIQGAQTSGILDQQAQLQGRNAQEALAKGQLDAERLAVIVGKRFGQIHASYAASGVTSDSGSVGAVLQASAANAELDRQNILYGAQVRAINYRNQQAMDQFSASQALTAGYIRAASGVIGAAASFTGLGAPAGAAIMAGGQAAAAGVEANTGGNVTKYDDSVEEVPF